MKLAVAGAGGSPHAIAMLLSDGSQSLAAAGGIRFSLALAGSMLVSLLGAWIALRIVARWR